MSRQAPSGSKQQSSSKSLAAPTGSKSMASNPSARFLGGSQSLREIKKRSSRAETLYLPALKKLKLFNGEDNVLALTRDLDRDPSGKSGLLWNQKKSLYVSDDIGPSMKTLISMGLNEQGGGSSSSTADGPNNQSQSQNSSSDPSIKIDPYAHYRVKPRDDLLWNFTAKPHDYSLTRLAKKIGKATEEGGCRSAGELGIFSNPDKNVDDENAGGGGQEDKGTGGAQGGGGSGPGSDNTSDEEKMFIENRHLLRLHQMYISPPTDDDLVVAETPIGTLRRDMALMSLFDALTDAVDVTALIEEQIEAIVTGDDAISFFARNSASTRLKFVYANRVPPHPLRFRPYDLVIVDDKNLDKEYFTISSNGIVWSLPGQPSEYLSITEWIGQSFAFNILSSMSVFRYYVARKILASWRRNTRYDVYKQKRKILGKKLFFAKPLFAPDLAACFEARQELLSVRVLALNDSFLNKGLNMSGFHSSNQFSLFSLQEFIDLQKAVCTQATKDLEAKHDKFINTLDNLIARVVKATSDDRLPHELLAETKQGEEGGTGGGAASASQPKTKSMVQLKLEAKERARRKRLAISDADMLSETIKLLDHVFQSCGVQLMIQAAKDFYDRVEGDPRQCNQRLFSVSVKFGDSDPITLSQTGSSGITSMILEPDFKQFHIMLENLWSSALAALTSVPLFVLCRQYEQFVSNSNNKNTNSGGGDLAIEGATGGGSSNRGLKPTSDICWEDLQFRDYTDKIKKKISSELQRAQTYADDSFLKQYRPVHDFGLTWDEEDFLSKHGAYNVLDIESSMRMMRDFEEAVEKCRVSHVVGFILIDAKFLKSELVPIPDRALKTMKSLLKTVGLELCKEVDKSYSGMIKQLDDRPAKLTDYANFVNTLYDDVLVKKESVVEQQRIVEGIYTTLKHFGQKISLEDQVRLESMQTKATSFSTIKIAEAKQFLKTTSEQMLEDNKGKCIKVEEECSTLQDELVKDIFIDPDYVTDHTKTAEVLQALEQVEERLEFCEKSANTYSSYENLLEYNDGDGGGKDGQKELAFGDDGEGGEEDEKLKFEFVHLERARDLFNQQQKLWELISTWGEQTRKWSHSDLSKLDTEQMNKIINMTYKTIFGLERSFTKNLQVIKCCKETVEKWKLNSACIIELANPAIRQRHWDKLFKQIGMNSVKGNNITLSLLEKNNIFKYKELVSEISAVASGEAGLESALEKIIAIWEPLIMPIQNHRNQKDLWILGDLSEIIVQIEDHCVGVSTMMGSRFISGIKDRVETWMKKLYAAADCIDEWLAVQRAWMYLENIFSAEDIQRQLPNETTKFKAVDRFWKELFRKVKSKAWSNAMDAMNMPGLKDQLVWANETLDQVQKSLEAYLETKRQGFPRFYFLSNDELLSILSQTRNPRAVQEHLCKCFDSINHVIFTEKDNEELGFNKIIAMKDHSSERVEFEKFVDPTIKSVEFWLNDIEDQMIAGLYTNAVRCLTSYPEDGTSRRDWLFGDFASQNILFIDQIHWTDETEKAILKIENLPDAEKSTKPMEDNIVFHKRQLENSIERVRENLTKLQRTLMGALVTLDVHGITVLENLVTDRCFTLNDFNWSKQLRYYWHPECKQVETPDVNFPSGGDADNVNMSPDQWVNGLAPITTSSGKVVTNDCVLKQTIACFKYSYEYLGNTPRLVVTPLTDKCYLTLTGALHLNYGGAPAGPAGTGKTETTKDLGKALAVPVIVFNCSDGLDYKIMGRFFSGLAQAGAWACFDEFNRIQVEVLSVIAQQMLTVTQAIRQRKKIFEFLGQRIPLNTRFGVFITMNPGYAGRAELPDNLKSLFRPVAMMVPDYALIAEIILYSEGFGEATGLSKKMVKMYALASEQLSKQDHYDFGMRAVKSVLVMAGQLKRRYPDLPENVTLIRALRDSNVPKFLQHDLPLFMGIITDLFPGVEIPNVDYGALEKEIINQLLEQKFQPVPNFVLKIIQLLETQLVRHGVMVVGLTMCGKSTNSGILAKSLTALKKSGDPDATFQLTKVFTLNPKSVTMTELYGNFNLNTGEWTDGLIAILVREAVSDNSDNKKWVNFDGPVDAIWIENMNTVLDDNKMLCLANGERIKLPPTMTMMFEVNDLAVASPATVSRCGMVYLEPVHLGYLPLVTTWSLVYGETYSAKLAKTLGPIITKLVKDIIPFYREDCSEAPGLDTLNNQLVHSMLKFINTFIHTRHEILSDDELKDKAPEELALLKPADVQMKLAKMYVVYSCIWTLGGNLHEKSRKKFQTFVRPMFNEILGAGVLPDSLDLYSLNIDDEKVEFIPISNIVPEYIYDAAVPFFNILVPTEETTGQRYILQNLMAAGYHVLFAGDTGVGKSVGIQQFLNTCGEQYAVATSNFSAQTSSANVVDIFENTLEKKRKNLLGPAPGLKQLMFIDDINMPLVEVYGAQPPIELLRQVMDQGGFYDRKKLFWKNIQDTQFIQACGPPGGGRNKVTPRLFRHSTMIWMPALPRQAMNSILSSILSGWLGANKKNLQSLAEPITKATVDGYFRITADLLPTPVKCHYTFNLRDPAKMIQGMMMVDVKKSLTNEDSLLNLWLHEAARCFRDRLINDTDQDWFSRMIATKMKEHLDKEWDPDDFKDLIYGDFLERTNKTYVQITDQAKMLQAFQDYLDEYNISFPTQMNLVFFQDCQRHLARIARILRQPRGNGLLVGVSGVGRKSIARLGAFLQEIQPFSIEITKNYDINLFNDDIRSMMFQVAKGTSTMFLFSDTQIVKETFLENINNVLNTGEVPNLFAPEEMTSVIDSVRPLAKAAGKEDKKDAIWQHFVQLVREQLHIVLAFSPVGEGFRARCRQFPSIINCATIDWFKPWPSDALYSVAERYYKSAPKELNLQETGVGLLSQLSCTIHSTSTDYAEKFFEALRRRTYTTPTSYLELIKLFCDLLGEKHSELSTKLDRYRVGVKKLNETQVIVDQLKTQLTKMAPEIEQAKKDTAALMEQVEKDQAIAAEQAAACAVDEKAALAQSAEANAIKESVQKDLDEALPEYYSAIKALDALDKKDITEVKSFAKPPPLVEVVLSAVCLLCGEKENWDSAKKLMNKPSFLDDLKTYDKDKLAQDKKKTKEMKRYTSRDDFKPDVVKSVSKAAMSLCMWVRAMEIYGRVSREIEPKKVKLAKAEESAAIAEKALAEKKAELKVVTDKVAALRQKLFQAKRKAEQLVKDAETCEVKLGRANELLAGLGKEAVSWEQRSTVLERAMNFLVGNIMLASGFIAYIGPYTAEFRGQLIDLWRNKAKEIDIVADPNWICADVLSDPAEIRQWNIDGLPQDQLSVENGIMVTRGRRWPLMIDPQGQANRWIRTMGKQKNIGIIKLTTPNFLRTLENGIRYGQAILLENVEETLDPSIEPVLLKQIFKKGGMWLLHLGTEDVPYSDEFAFYITTKMANPHYLPEICIKVTIINFTVTPVGLENQLVAEVVANESSELWQKKAGLVVQIAADKATMDQLEAKILQLLADSKGDILEDDKLIKVLAKSSETGDQVKTRMQAAEETLGEIDELTEKLRPTATRLSILYFCISYMSLIDPMYQYSLEYFVTLAKGRLVKSEKSDDIDKRIQIIIKDSTENVYLNICRGLFEDHKMIFSFMITGEILRNPIHAKFFNKTPVGLNEWSFLLRGLEAGKGLIDQQVENPETGELETPAREFTCPEFLAQNAFDKIDCLEKLARMEGIESYNGLTEDLSINANGLWEKFYEDDDCIKIALPICSKTKIPWDDKLKPIQRLLVCRSLRENLWSLGVKRFINDDLGSLFIESPPFDLVGSFSESTCMTPIIFVLSAGADPTAYLLKLANDRNYGDRLHFISLGQGQGPKAAKLVDQCRESGDWACLQNCHLAASWMPQLERIQELQEVDKTDPEYRLWLTSMPTPVFPVPVLQSGIKITNEPPKGLKSNLMRTFDDMSEEAYEAMSNGAAAEKETAYKRLIYALAFFHAVILQRRKFGPIGWNIPYEWMDSDLQTSREQVYMYLVTQPGVPLRTLNYMVAECNYGGRVTDDKDVRLICAILQRYFSEDVVNKPKAPLSSIESYHVPLANSLTEVKDFIRQMPLDEDPRVFALHPNALITAQLTSTRLFLSTVESVQPRIASGGGGKKPEDIVSDMCRDFLESIPDTMKEKYAHADTYRKTADGGIVSLGVFHFQEMSQFNTLSGMIRSSIHMLGQAIKGLVVMSAQLEEMYNFFLIQKVPTTWMKKSYPCLKPLNSYMSDFLLRLAFIEDWLRNGPSKSYWLSAMFFPQGFMTAAMQMHARATQIAIDELKFNTNVTKMYKNDVTEPAEVGVNMHGLFLQGCDWSLENSYLDESRKGILFVELPVIWLQPLTIKEHATFVSSLSKPQYNCPLYKTSERRGTLSTTGHSTNFVMFMQYDYKDKDPHHWCRRGVACLCMLDD